MRTPERLRLTRVPRLLLWPPPGRSALWTAGGRLASPQVTLLAPLGEII